METATKRAENTDSAIKAETDALAHERADVLSSLTLKVALDDSTTDAGVVRDIFAKLATIPQTFAECCTLAESLTMPASDVRTYLRTLAGEGNAQLTETIAKFVAEYGVRKILKQQKVNALPISSSTLRLLANLYGTTGDSWTPTALGESFDFPSCGIVPAHVTEAIIGEDDSDNAVIRYVQHVASSTDKPAVLKRCREMVRFVALHRQQQQVNRKLANDRKAAYARARGAASN